jgi:hypothetical protein
MDKTSSASHDQVRESFDKSLPKRMLCFVANARAEERLI